MIRRGFLKLMAAAQAITATKTTRQYYITGGWDDCTHPPLVVEADSRLDAIIKAGFTVWNEEEWKDFQVNTSARFKKGCEANEELRKKRAGKP